MRTCNSCGGIIGRDCFNPMECATITFKMESEERNRVQSAIDAQVDDHYNLEYLNNKFFRLIEHLKKQGVDLSEFEKEIQDELPF